MKSSSALIVSSVLAVAVVTACAQTAEEAPEEAGLSAEQRNQIGQMLVENSNDWGNSVREGDPSVLERILAPDFIYTVNSGEVHDKASFIALWVNDDFTFDSFGSDDVEVRWYTDEVVVITGTVLWSGQDSDGNSLGGKARWTNVYVERDGEWQVVVGHSTAVE